MSTLLIGARGQLGSDLAASLPNVIGVDHEQFEITDETQVFHELRRLRPRTVINTAAYNLVDRAELEPSVAHRVNVDGPAFLAVACEEIGAKLVHFSTDYVFGGPSLGRARTEDDEPSPTGNYGRSKLRGELRVREAGASHLVIRTCGLYGRAATRAKGNFVLTMLRLGATRDEVRVVADQRCTPTSTADLAVAVRELLERDASGLLHVTNAGAMTWAEFATEIFRQAGLSTRVIPITSTEFAAGRTEPTAERPVDSVLNCQRAEEKWGVKMRPWQAALAGAGFW